MNNRRRGDETQSHHDDSGGERRRPVSKNKRRARKEVKRAPWVLALLAIVLLVGAIAGGLLWRAQRPVPTSSSPSANSSTSSATETAAGSSDLEAAIAEADRLDPGWRWDQLWAKGTTVLSAENSARILKQCLAAFTVSRPTEPGTYPNGVTIVRIPSTRGRS